MNSHAENMHDNIFIQSIVYSFTSVLEILDRPIMNGSD